MAKPSSYGPLVPVSRMGRNVNHPHLTIRVRIIMVKTASNKLNDATQILNAYSTSLVQQEDLQSELFCVLYDELKKIAIGQMKKEDAGHTLQATALVHETFIKLLNLKSCNWENRHHFFVSASETMRRILIDHARTRNRLKRGGDWKQIRLADVDAFQGSLPEFDEVRRESILALETALVELEKLDRDKAAVVKLRFFARMTYRQIADILHISHSTVERYWAFSKAWLNRQMSQQR